MASHIQGFRVQGLGSKISKNKVTALGDMSMDEFLLSLTTNQYGLIIEEEDEEANDVRLHM